MAARFGERFETLLCLIVVCVIALATPSHACYPGADENEDEFGYTEFEPIWSGGLGEEMNFDDVFVSEDNSKYIYPTEQTNFASRDPETDNGGWNLPDRQTELKFHSDACSIEKLPVVDWPAFQHEFRFKQPVILTFPNGAADWTVPVVWSRHELKRKHGDRQVNLTSVMGLSSDVESPTVRLVDFIEKTMPEMTSQPQQGKYLVEDRSFLLETGMIKTLNRSQILPRTILDEFTDPRKHVHSLTLGGAGSGVMFHKHAEAIHPLMFGQKRWFVYPAGQEPPRGPSSGSSLAEWLDQVYPRLHPQERPLECVQYGGEVMYLPDDVYHAHINVGDSIGIDMQ